MREADHVRRAIYGFDAIFKEPSIISYAQPSCPVPRSNPEHPQIQIVKELREYASAEAVVLQTAKERRREKTGFSHGGTETQRGWWNRE